MPRLTEQLLQGLNKLDEQSFRPGDSTILSTINHPIDAVKEFGKFLAKQTNTAAGIPDQYDNPYPLLAPPPDAQSQAAFDLAGMAQVGSFPFAPKSSGGTLGSITAWHGSPHKFDKFSMDKIGTGEGAQAYGHGLYFAENPEVAKNYQDWLGKSELLLNGKRLVNPDWNAYGARNPWILDEMEGLIPEKFTEKAKLSTGRESKKLLPNLAEHFNLMKDKGVFEEDGIWSTNPLEQEFFDWVKSQNPEYHKGSLYKTSLEWPDPAREAADPLGPQHFLDWDKPLSEQPENIASALPMAIKNMPEHQQKLFDEYPLQPFALGKDLKEMLGERHLKAAGIPGIRYLDGGSRGAGEGSYNYVVFDDQIPKIVERNGNPLSYLLPATMLGWGMANQQDSDPLTWALSQP